MTGECGDRTEPGIFYDGNDLAWRNGVGYVWCMMKIISGIFGNFGGRRQWRWWRRWQQCRWRWWRWWLWHPGGNSYRMCQAVCRRTPVPWVESLCSCKKVNLPFLHIFLVTGLFLFLVPLVFLFWFLLIIFSHSIVQILLMVMMMMMMMKTAMMMMMMMMMMMISHPQMLHQILADWSDGWVPWDRVWAQALQDFRWKQKEKNVKKG